MEIIEDIHVVGGGIHGIGLTHKLDSNVYLIDGGDEIALIDAGVGVEPERILEEIIKKGFRKDKISKLFLTHAHLDHSGGAAYLKKKLNVEILASAKEAPYLENGDEEAIGLTKAKKSGIYPDQYKLSSVKVGDWLDGYEEKSVGKYFVKVIPTPGHSRGSLSFMIRNHKKKILFTGDAVALGGYISLQNLPDSSLTEYEEGINNLNNLDIDSLFPSHYGFTINYGQYHIDLIKEALEGTNNFKKALKL